MKWLNFQKKNSKKIINIFCQKFLPAIKSLSLDQKHFFANLKNFLIMTDFLEEQVVDIKPALKFLMKHNVSKKID